MFGKEATDSTEAETHYAQPCSVIGFSSAVWILKLTAKNWLMWTGPKIIKWILNNVPFL